MENCTIIIPTWNRTNYLKRLLSYYDEHGRDFLFIVVDSSSEENKKINKKNISLFPGMSILYLDYPNHIHPVNKFLDAANYIKTKYSVHCADDDFIVPNGIRESINFLESNPDFSITHGKYISFCVRKSSAGQPEFCWQFTYPHKPNVHDDVIDRITQHLSDYRPTLFAVHRTEVFKNIWRDTLNSGLDLVLNGELLHSVLTFTYGKMKVLSNFYCARQEDTAYATSHGIKRQTFTDYLEDGRFEPEYEKFKKYLIEKIVQTGGGDKKNMAVAIDAAMAKYTKASYPPTVDYYRYKIAAKAVSFFKEIRLSGRMYRLLSLTYRRFFPISASKPDHDFRDTDLASCQKDLDVIRNKVISFSGF